MRALLDDATIDAALAGSGWDRRGRTLYKSVVKRDFSEALAYVNKVGELAESANHHPDIGIFWNKVELELTTHSAGGLTQADVDLARRIDGLD